MNIHRGPLITTANIPPISNSHQNMCQRLSEINHRRKHRVKRGSKKNITNSPKPPKIQRATYEISPYRRLWIAREAIEKGCKVTASAMGLSRSAISRWVCAYRIKGSQAHIFKINCNRWREDHEVKNDKGRWACKFSIQEKQRIIEEVERGKSNVQVAFECGLSPDTIGKWRKELQETPCVICGTHNMASCPVLSWNQRGNGNGVGHAQIRGEYKDLSNNQYTGMKMEGNNYNNSICNNNNNNEIKKEEDVEIDILI